MKKIIVSCGYHATNIGNAFYEIGAGYALKKSLGGEAQVILSSNKPDIYWSRLLKNKAAAFDYSDTYLADYVVIMGPTLSLHYLDMWKETFKRFSANGTRVVLMSAGANRYDDREYSEVSRFLEEHKLYALLSRDSATYELYKDMFEHSYDGICCALYSCDYAPAYRTDMEPYVIFNFDNCIEPSFTASDNGDIVIGGRSYEMRRHRFVRGHQPDRLESGEKIIRTIHTVMPGAINRRNNGGNQYLSDVPYDYLNLYANATAVITNRVHAAVASVSYGTPVHLTNSSPRGNILKRVKCDEVYNRVFKSDVDFINREKRKYEDEIRKIFV